MSDDNTLNYGDMLEIVKEEINWKLELRDNDVIIYEQDGHGYFTEISEARARMKIRKKFKTATPSTISNLVKGICEDEDRILDPDLFTQSRMRVVGFLNGVFDLRTGQVREYSQDYVIDPLPHKIPYELKPETEKWFLGVLAAWVGEETADWFLDLLAYLLFIFPNNEQIWINFFGMGSNGKSVCQELLQEILGKEKVIGCDLENINRFSNATFDGKWLVLGRDSSSFVSPKATNFIKTYSGDESGLVEVKGGGSWDTVTAGKLLVSTNTLIQSQDRTFSWYRRLIPIPFPNTFKRDPVYKKNLFKRLPQIMRLLLHRAYCYINNQIPLQNAIPYPVEQLRTETRYFNDRVAAFWELEYFTEPDDDATDRTRALNVEKVKHLDGMRMGEVYFLYHEWHDSEFSGESVEPSLKTFGGPYGAFLQTGAGAYFEYKKTRAGRVLQLRKEKLEEVLS